MGNEKNLKTQTGLISTQRLLLRKFEENDLMHVYKGLSDYRVNRFYGVRFDSPEATMEQMRFFSEIEQDGTGLWRAVCDRETLQFMGACGLNSISKAHRNAELGFWLLPDFWGKGIIHEALSEICRIGFDVLGLHRIEAKVESENKRSEKTLLQAGFVHEGRLKDCEWKDNRFISLDIYAGFKK